ncbi:hypothetical protein ABZX85_33535 [Streptomyces sp. NPDC004539]|uniref:hypothetical protein n=1 Tax=Streptomyces sp. NPDC004539 TaxID=3154280 RepID=UPI0033A6D321
MDTPPTCEVPHFSPVRVRGARYRLGRLARQRRRALALGLAVTAAGLVAAGPQEGGRGGERARGRPGEGGGPLAAAASPRAVAARPGDSAGSPRGAGVSGRGADGETVSAPVRIADAETVRLLRPGDRVDVIASEPASAGGGEARVVARGALVSKVPEPFGGRADSGALVVLSVPRGAAARLAGAGVTERLAVTLW